MLAGTMIESPGSKSSGSSISGSESETSSIRAWDMANVLCWVWCESLSCNGV
jgi:hypothetical protein